MSLHTLLLQFACLGAPFMHLKTDAVTPFLFRGPDPKVKQIYKLHDQGIKTIVSLRTNPERKKERLCQSLGMQWIQIRTGVFKTPSDDQLDEFLKIVNSQKYRPIYVSCEIDMDRTEVYLMAYRAVEDHWTYDEIDRDFKVHHQKRWWPIFPKYQHVIASYAEKRAAQPQAEVSSSASAVNTVQDLQAQ